MKLIKELTEDIEIITEGVGADKKYFFEGITIQCDIGNRNKRYYSSGVVDPEVDRYIREYVNANRAFGELGHPQGPTINLDRVSHMFTKLQKEGSNYVSRAKVLDTPMGRIVKNLLDEGAKLGVSSRGLGSLKMNSKGLNEVQKDFYLSTAGDIVADPSAPDAFVQGIMEDAEWIFENGSWTPRMHDETKRLIKSAHSKQLEEVTLRQFQAFLNSI